MISVDIYLIDMNLDTNNGEVWAGGKQFVPFIYLFINFAKRPGSLTEQAPLRGPKKKKKENYWYN